MAEESEVATLFGPFDKFKKEMDQMWEKQSLPLVEYQLIPTLNGQAMVGTERLSALDSKITRLMSLSRMRLVEWLLENHILRDTPPDTPTNLKLKSHSDLKRYINSDGNAWVGNGVDKNLVSIFAGSMFEGFLHPPSILLKLVYHWASKKDNYEVLRDCNIEVLTLKYCTAQLRSVCTSALHTKVKQLGGTHKKVQVAICGLSESLRASDGGQLWGILVGAFDEDSKSIFMRVFDLKVIENRNFSASSATILEPLRGRVHPDSILLIDPKINQETLVSMGFNNLWSEQLESKDPLTNSRFVNAKLMNYMQQLGKYICKNSILTLKLETIQQLLDEVLWREHFGLCPTEAFANILSHLAEQTNLDEGGTLSHRLANITLNPFTNWSYNVQALHNSQQVINESPIL